MKTSILIIYIFICVINISCKSNEIAIHERNLEKKEVYKTDDGVNIVISDTTFVNLKDYSSDFIFDLKYATEDNFLKVKVYDCAKCYLRLKTVKALIDANNQAITLGYRIKLFDCYRPLDVQKKMWTIVSNPKFVADPKKGSIHNRGGAVDITLVDFNGKELDMGTAFDYFGEAAGHNYKNLSDSIKSNRMLLKNIMLNATFKSFDSEWWHYNLSTGLDEKVSNFKWNCD